MGSGYLSLRGGTTKQSHPLAVSDTHSVYKYFVGLMSCWDCFVVPPRNDGSSFPTPHSPFPTPHFLLNFIANSQEL
ncbi:MAG: hypothetical protein KME64_20640 [Scytonematopsis contorta HA4267-MV1]|nr:hypothetical protein [Scytonematopsis contorta HA4267-MV1]